MADRAKKISELTALTSPSGDDLFVIVDSPSSNAITKKVTVAHAFNNTSANVTIKSGYYLNANNVYANNLMVTRKQTPVVSTGTSDVMGSIWFDDNYVYVATANGVVKRAALSTF
jgi:hypothetical protein